MTNQCWKPSDGNVEGCEKFIADKAAKQAVSKPVAHVADIGMPDVPEVIDNPPLDSNPGYHLLLHLYSYPPMTNSFLSFTLHCKNLTLHSSLHPCLIYNVTNHSHMPLYFNISIPFLTPGAQTILSRTIHSSGHTTHLRLSL